MFIMQCNTTSTSKNFSTTPFYYQGHNYNRVIYKYDHCEGFRILVSDLYETGVHRGAMYCNCNPFFPTAGRIAFVAAVLGLILNTLVLLLYIRRKAIRPKISCILLAHQAIVDIVNCLFFLFPYCGYHTFLLHTKIHPVTWNHSQMALIIICLWCLSAASSILSFTLTALERCMAVWMPLWHRANLSKLHIMRAFGLIWLTSILATGILAAVRFTSYQAAGILRIVFASIAGSLVLFVTFLFSITYYKALLALRSNKKRAKSSLEVARYLGSIKRELHLTAVFVAMYVFFFAAFVPLILVILEHAENVAQSVSLVMFALSSFLNPTITLVTRRDFKLRCIQRGRSYSVRKQTRKFQNKEQVPMVATEH